MTIPSYKIAFNGEDSADDIYENIIRLEIHEDIKKATSFMFRISIALQEQGEWSYLDDERFELFKKVTVSFGFGEGNASTYFEGYITHLAPHFDPEEELCYLEIRGMDATCLMNLEEKIASWTDMTHSDIASEIFNHYGITPEVAPTSVMHAENGNMLLQRGTDIRFLRELAERNGFDCYIGIDSGGEVKGYFRSYALDVTPLPELAVHFEGETNVRFLDVQVTGNQPLNAFGWHLSLEDKEIEQMDITDYETNLLGSDSISSIVRPKIEALCSPVEYATRVYQGNPVNVDSVELEHALQARMDRHGWFIKATGTVESEAYSNLIHARDIIPVKGLGTRYSGIYLVSGVKSSLADGHFEQQIELIRNAWGLTGNEPFGGES